MAEKNYYMDNAAATRLDEAVLSAMTPFFFECYAVATSEFAYSLGIEAKEALEDARSRLAGQLGAQPEEFIFTSGSAESSNLAIKGAAKAGNKRHIIVSKTEDFPVLHSAKSLEKQGFSIDYLNVDADGLVDMTQLKSLLSDETLLVSIQHANQEIGTVQNIDEIGRLCHENGAFFHTDATHTFRRVPLDVRKTAVDMVTVSAHTINGPKGIGGLYVRKGTKISKIIDGGFQEFNLRAGAQNIPGAAGFAKAAELVTDEENDHLAAMRDKIIDTIMETVPNVTLNGHRTQRTPQNANITFHHVEGESITLHLDMYGISVSTGSACFSKSLEGSHVISAIGGDHERIHGSLRFTLSRFNTMDDIDFVIETLSHVVKQLRQISPLGKS